MRRQLAALAAASVRRRPSPSRRPRLRATVFSRSARHVRGGAATLDRPCAGHLRGVVACRLAYAGTSQPCDASRDRHTDDAFACCDSRCRTCLGRAARRSRTSGCTWPLGWFGYLVLLGGWIVLQKREPVATLSWLLGLALLPYVGFLIYYVFGPQRIQRQRLRRARTRAALPAAGRPRRPAPMRSSWRKLAQATTGLPPTTATRRAPADRRRAPSTTRCWPTIAQATRPRPPRVLHLHAGPHRHRAARCAGRTRARRRARCACCWMRSARARPRGASSQPLLEAGGELAWFHPHAASAAFWQRPWLNMRTHRKIVVIDGRIAYTGGINITDDEDERLRSDAYRDLHLRLEGDVGARAAAGVRRGLGLRHRQTATASPHRARTRSREPGRSPTQVLMSGPDSSWEAIHRLHVAAIHAARHAGLAGRRPISCPARRRAWR